MHLVIPGIIWPEYITYAKMIQFPGPLGQPGIVTLELRGVCITIEEDGGSKIAGTSRLRLSS